MKIKLLTVFAIVFFVLLNDINLFSQWITQTSGTTQRLRQVRAVDSSVVWICGNAGIVLSTTNGGNYWIIKTPTDTLYTNYSIDAISDQIAWVTGTSTAGVNFKIWKTTDGGNSWQVQYQNSNGFANGIRFFDANNGICFADPDPYPSTNWEILTTSNGGTIWNRVPEANFPPADVAVGEYGVAGAIDIIGNTIWACTWAGSGGTRNRIYKSTDMGLNWTVSYYTTVEESGSHYIAFSDTANGVDLSLNGELCLTSDGGTNWSVSNVYPITYKFVANIPGTNEYIGVGNFGLASYSTDGGSTWTPTTTGTLNSLYGVDATFKYAWAVGEVGTVIKSFNTDLPVELISFTAEVFTNDVNLNWSTATEINNRGFEIQRKFGTNDYLSLSFIKGQGSSQKIQSYSYTDENLKSGKYSYRLKQIDFNGTFEYSKTIEVELKSPNKFDLRQNYPNPFNPQTIINYQLAKETKVTLKIFDALGKEVVVLVNEVKPAGIYEVTFDSTNLPNGVYFYSLQAGNFSATKKLVYIK
jgi:photosystem II stability/assembly factor-like uncharacterized protein